MTRSSTVAALADHGVRTGSPVALVVGASTAVLAWNGPDGGGTTAGHVGIERASLPDAPGAISPGGTLAVPLDTAASVLREIDDELRPRWVWWSANAVLAPLLASACPGPDRVTQPAALPRLRACWDLAAVHRLLAGGWRDDPARVWAHARSLRPEDIPAVGQLELLGSGAGADDDGDPAEPVRPDGHLRPDWSGGAWRADPSRMRRWAELALEVQGAQAAALPALGCRGDAALTARSESAAAMLAVELAADGLPVDRAAAERLLSDLVGPRPADEAAARQARSERDNRVLSLAPPTAAETDLRNPAQVRTMLAAAGIDVPDTRSWRLERSAALHPVIPALLTWRRTERISTTYGYDWLDRHVGPDGRLRGSWTASDGGAGRMTAQTGLHNLPAEMRVVVAARPGHLLVRADLGQVEPRVLAAVSGDRALAAAAAADDLYLPVAQRIGCSRDVAKVAVLAAMYGQTSGAAGQALSGMKRSYPVAIGYLDDADAAGRAGRDVRTYGGRLIRTQRLTVPPAGAEEATHAAHRSAVAAKGRYVRNAVVQGAAAELFKAWAATVRADLLDRGAGGVVLCLHDELLLHVRDSEAEAVAAALVPALERTAARWFRGREVVRLVADVSVVERWSEAKG